MTCQSCKRWAWRLRNHWRPRGWDEGLRGHSEPEGSNHKMKSVHCFLVRALLKVDSASAAAFWALGPKGSLREQMSCRSN